MEFNWPGEKLLVKLFDTVGSKGIGSLLKPWQMRREGAAAAEIKRLNSLTLAQTKMEVADIQAGKKVLLPGGKLEVVSVAKEEDEAFTVTRLEIITELDEIIKANVLTEALRREVSVAKAVLYAEQELAQDTQPPPDDTISDDWLLRWRENAAGVSSEELQSLWGKVLAGELKAPGRFTLRVLDFLRNLSRVEAEELNVLSLVVMNDGVFRCDEALSSIGLTSTVFQSLEELGIISGAEPNGLTRTIGSTRPERYESTILSGSRVIFIQNDDPEKKVNFPIYTITQLGRQILRLVNNDVSEDYFRAIGESIKAQGFDASAGDFTMISATQLQMTNLKPV